MQIKSSPALCLITALLLTFAAASSGHAQIPGSNVNMVSGIEWPGGDPFLQRQNEPAIAVSTRNPLHLLAGANDYRTVDLPGLFGGKVVGDAWLGVFKSFDGGLTWRSTLIPGFPQDTTQAGLLSALTGYAAGADPIVRAGTNGLFYYGGLVFRREAGGQSALFVAKFIDNNNSESADPIEFLNISLVATGTTGQFVDKPWMAVDIPRAGAGQCTAGNQTFAAGNVYMSYSVLSGEEDNNLLSKITLARSTNCGTTWTRTEVSDALTINQGSALAIDPNTGAVYIAWRQFQSPNRPDAILIAKSVDGGKTFSTGTPVHVFTPFEQGTTNISFRTNAYPSMAIDGAGRVHLAWSERGVGPQGDARVMVASSPDGINWPAPVPADPSAARGHQLMPSITFAAGKLMLVYHDLREDHTIGIFTPLGNGQYAETRVPVGDLPDDPGKVFTNFIMDAAPAGFSPLKRRHTVDVRATQADVGSGNPAQPVVFGASQRVSQYIFGSRPGSDMIEQLQVNPPNLPMFKKGTVPFHGDYLDVAGLMFLPTAQGGWMFNTAPSSSNVFHATWTDNRDVRPPPGNPPDWTKYTPPGFNTGPSLFDPSQNVPPCDSTLTGSRNQNVYTSRLSDGLFVGVPANSKPLGTILVDGQEVLLQRAFSIFVQNTTFATKSFRLSIADPQPIGGQASFSQSGPVLKVLDVTIAPRSSVSRTVFVTSTDRKASVVVNVAEISAPGAGDVLTGGLRSTVTLNPDATNPDLVNIPNIGTPDIANAEVYNPDIANQPEVANQDIANPDIANPDIANQDIANPDIANPDIANQDIANPDIANPDIANQDIANPDIANQDIANGALTDTTWEITNKGNTTSSYAVKLLLNGHVPNGFKLQLILHRTYLTPVARGCTLGVQRHNIIFASIPNPAFSDPMDVATVNASDPSITNATLGLAPGEIAKITLRVLDPNRSDNVTFNAATAVSPVVVAQAINTLDLLGGNNAPPLTLAITTTGTSLSEGFKGTEYEAQLQAIGGTGPYTWTLVDGSLPSGLTLQPNGMITGTPTARGLSVFTVTATDSSATPRVATRQLSINVANRFPVADVQPAEPLVISEGGPSLDFTASATDADGDPLTYDWAIVSTPSVGVLTSNGNTAAYTNADGPSAATIHVAVSDGAGGVVNIVRDVQVLNVAPIVDPITAPVDPVPLGTVVSASAGFADPGTLDSHTAVWEWGDGTSSPGVVTPGQPAGTVSGTHTYSAPGVYPVKVTVTDKDGGLGEATFLYVVIFDAAESGTSVTGGGRIQTPAGSYPSDPAFNGKGSFGFIAKPKRRGSPLGQAEFHAGDFTLHSVSYTSLTISGAKAQLRGKGTVNGGGDYSFLISVIDGQVKGGGGADRFRIKIWNTATGLLFYDNQTGATDSATVTQPVITGDIKIK